MKSRLVTKKEGGRDLSRPRGPLELCIAVKTSGTEFKFHKLVRPLHPRCNQVGWSRPTKLDVSFFHLLCLIPQHPLCLREKPRPHEVDAVPGKRGCLFQADRIRIWALTNHNADALEIPYGDPLLLFFFSRVFSYSEYLRSRKEISNDDQLPKDIFYRFSIKLCSSFLFQEVFLMEICVQLKVD